MNITLDQAVEIYARGLRTRMGRLAFRSARKEADRLREAGDHHGFIVWQRVANCIEDTDTQKADAGRR